MHTYSAIINEVATRGWEMNVGSASTIYREKKNIPLSN